MFIGYWMFLLRKSYKQLLESDPTPVLQSKPGLFAPKTNRPPQADARVRSLGISGVPFFIFNQKLTVAGALDPATLLAAMQQAAAGKD